MTELLTHIDNFHFLRPLWLLAIIPLAFIIVGLWFLKRNAGAWTQVIEPHLLPYLVDKQNTKSDNTPSRLVAIAWLIGCIALAGPVWQQLPQPVEQKVDALVIVLDLSQSMNSTDLAPSRIARARHKLSDILEAREEGLTALIVYAGTPHTVTPLTDDTNTIALMIPSFSPSIMPSQGSQVPKAIEKASKLLIQAGHNEGRILLLTDGIEEDDFDEWIDGSDITLSILGIGTREGAPIPDPNGGFIKDSSGGIVIPQLDSNELRRIATTYGGDYAEIRYDDADIRTLLSTRIDFDPETTDANRQFDVWQEEGHYLVFLILPLAAFAFRKGWLKSLAPTLIIPSALLLGLASPPAQANFWDDLWITQDQKAMKAYEKGDYEKAAKLFEDEEWRAAAEYRNKQYAQAAKSFESVDNSSGHFNRGNALAKDCKLEEALLAYDKALALASENLAAKANKELLLEIIDGLKEDEDLLPTCKNKSEDQEQEQEQEGSGDSENSEEQESEEQESDEQDSDEQQSQDQKQSDEQNQNSDESQQNSSDQQDKSDQNGEDQQGENQESQEQQSQDEEESAQENNEGTNSQESKDGEQEEERVAIDDSLNTEEEQALQQWLRRIPDDPSGLLRKKFLYESQNLLQPTQQENEW